MYPEFKNIKIIDGDDIVDIVHGITSKFVFNDIKFYIENWSHTDSDNMKSHRLIINIIEYLLNINFKYIPSPDSLRYILSKSKFDYLTIKNIISFMINPPNTWYDDLYKLTMYINRYNHQ